LRANGKPLLANHSKSVGAEGAPKGRHNPKSGDWDAIEVVVTTAIEVQPRKSLQPQRRPGLVRQLELQQPLLDCYRNGNGGSCGGSPAVAGTVAVAVQQ
jgi:hypothetical protein